MQATTPSIRSGRETRRDLVKYKSRRKGSNAIPMRFDYARSFGRNQRRGESTW